VGIHAPPLKSQAQRPNPVFQGFRYIAFTGNTITHVRYITMPELRAAGLRQSWEPRVLTLPPLEPTRRTRLKTAPTSVPRLNVKKAPGLTSPARTRRARVPARATGPAS
jgi:hypothetical protein